MDELYKKLKTLSEKCSVNEKKFIEAYLDSSMIEGLLRDNPDKVKTPIAYCNFIIVDDYFYDYLVNYSSFNLIKMEINPTVIKLKRKGATYLKCFVGYTEKDMIP